MVGKKTVKQLPYYGNPEKGYYHSSIEQMNGTLFINPSFYLHENSEHIIAEVRRARQHGKFTLQHYDKCITGLDEQEEFNRDYFSYPRTIIEKYLIPAKYKAQLRLDLISKGFHGEFLYASNDGEINKVRDYCRSLLAP